MAKIDPNRIGAETSDSPTRCTALRQPLHFLRGTRSFFILSGLASWLGTCPPEVTAADEAPRVALMNWTCDDNSYRSAEAVANFVSLLQADLSNDGRYQWVERTELARAENELGLGKAGLADPVETLRTGKWARADWGIRGEVSTNQGGFQTLALEAVDLRRADILASAQVEITVPIEGPFRFQASALPVAATAVRQLLQEARRVYDAEKSGTVVALLCFCKKNFMPTPDDLEMSVRESFLADSTNAGKYHFVQFRRPGEAMGESRLVLRGLAENDPNSWQRVADVYLWGDFSRDSGPHPGDTVVRLKMNVWDGQGEPELVTLAFTNRPSSADIARELAATIRPLLRHGRSTPPVDNIRGRISKAIMASREPYQDSYLGAPWGRLTWLDNIQSLEAACFVNPENGAAREQWIRVRWSKQAELAAVSPFHFAQRKSEEWGKYVDQFGFNSTLPAPLSPTITASYVISAWPLLETWNGPALGGIPRDVGRREIAAWQNQYGAELERRLAKAPEDPAVQPLVPEFFARGLMVPDVKIRSAFVTLLWPRIMAQAKEHRVTLDQACLSPLHKHFEDIGEPDGDQKLLAELAAANASHPVGRSNPGRAAAAPPPVNLPRASGSPAAVPGGVFPTTAPAAHLPPLIRPEPHLVNFPSTPHVERVKSMLFHDGTLWMVADTTEELNLRSITSESGRDVRPMTQEQPRLWMATGGGTVVAPVAGPLATNIVNNITYQENTLWLALKDAGIAALDLKTTELRRYGLAEGLPDTNQSALTETSRGMVAMSGAYNLSILDNGTSMWKPLAPTLPRIQTRFAGEARRIAGAGHKLLLSTGAFMLLDMNAKAWKPIDDATIGQSAIVTGILVDNDQNFWAAGYDGICQINAETGLAREQRVEKSALSNLQNTESRLQELPAVLSRGRSGIAEARQVAEIQSAMAARQRDLALTRSQTNQAASSRSASRLTTTVYSIGLDGDFLWVLFSDSLRLYHIPSRSWVGGYSFFGIGTPQNFACGGGRLWVAVRLLRGMALASIDPTALKATPHEQWLPDLLTHEEEEARTQSGPSSERIMRQFFSGDDDAVIAALKGKTDVELDPQALFFLIKANEETGNPDLANHFKTVLQTRFPESVFIRALQSTPSPTPPHQP